jgi:hypothetical protein
MPLSARADPMTAASAAVARKSAFMLWITPLRDAPPTKWELVLRSIRVVAVVAELMIRLKQDGHMPIQDKNGIWTV